MEYKEAMAILQSLLERQPLDDKQKEAVVTAIGVLSWASLSESRIQAQKAKRDKNAEW